MEGCDLRGFDLSGADLESTSFNGADLSGASIGGANLRDSNLVGALLADVRFTSSVHSGLVWANLDGTYVGANSESWRDCEGGAGEDDLDWSCRDMTGADFAAMDLEGANFAGALLVGASFRDANIRHANFSGAQIHGADFRGADLSGASFDAECRMYVTSSPRRDRDPRFAGATCADGEPASKSGCLVCQRLWHQSSAPSD